MKLTARVSPEPAFVGDHPAMDFLNSIEKLADTRTDWLADGAGFLKWLDKASLLKLPVSGVTQSSGEPVLEQAAANARALREWWRAFVGKHAGRTMELQGEKDLVPLNDILANEYEFDQLIVVSTGEGQGASVRTHRLQRRHGAEQLMLPVARQIAQFLCSEDFELVRNCEGPKCSMMFLDRTKSHKRRWCAMAVCGNRAKVAAHRARAGRQ